MRTETQRDVEMAELTDRLRDDAELRFAAVMLVVSVVVLAAIRREARSEDG